MLRRSLTNARIILTGASGGIGRELALAFARRSASLLLVARRQELLQSLSAECQQLGAATDYVVGDIADPTVREAVVERAENLWGAVDVLVNNAGTSAHGRFADSDESTLRQIMEVNFFAATELTRLALPLLRSAAGNNPQSTLRNPSVDRPAIVNIASILAHRGVPFNSEYCASKFALRGWSESLRAELAAEGIDVLLVSPGTVDTEFVDHLIARRSNLPWSGAKGIEPATVAEQAVRALEKGSREIYPNWRGWGLVVANSICPRCIDRIMARFGRKRP